MLPQPLPLAASLLALMKKAAVLSFENQDGVGVASSL